MTIRQLKFGKLLFAALAVLLVLTACVPASPAPHSTATLQSTFTRAVTNTLPAISPTQPAGPAVSPSAGETLQLPPTETPPVSGLVLPVATAIFPPEPAVFPAPAATLIPSPGETLDRQAVVLRIHNVDKLTGRAGQLTRWLAWGTPAWTIAADGSYWLIDVTNGDFRLSHLDPHGMLLETLPICARMMSDIAAGERFVWVLANNNDGMATVVQVDRASGVETHFTVPPGYQPDTGLTGITVDATGCLLLERFGGVFFTRFLTAQGKLDLRDLPGYSVRGRVFRLSSGKACDACFAAGPPYSEPCVACIVQGPVWIDDFPVEIVAGEYNNYLAWIGAAADGSFYVAGMGAHSADLAAQHYSADGEFLGIARIPNTYLYVESFNNLAVGPDGELYALISQSDQDVAVVRLRFSERIDPLPTLTPYPDTMPTSPPPLLPAWSTPPPGTPPEQAAQAVLLAFLSHLDQRQYAQAGELYGGGMEAFAPRCTGNWKEACDVLEPLQTAPAEFWERACSTLLACFSAGKIAEVEQISSKEFRFWVELTWEEGTYAAHACCGGDPAITPFVWLFPFTVREVDGQYRVLDPPPVLE